jgi:hypothetical protein
MRKVREGSMAGKVQISLGRKGLNKLYDHKSTIKKIKFCKDYNEKSI